MADMKIAARNDRIVVRKPKFDFSKVDKHYYRGSALFTHINNALSLIFPEGERFFIRSVKHFQDQIVDPKLRDEIKDFIGQEIQHGKAHEHFNEMLTAQGFETDSFLTFFEQIGVQKLEEFANRLLGEKMALSVTAAVEHYTASLAHAAFEAPQIFDGLDETIKELLFWHAAEEIEHKHVAFDVLETVDDNYLLRVSGMVMATILLFGYATAGTVHLMRQENEPLRNIALNFIEMFKQKHSIFPTSFKALISYFKPGFHPNDIDDLSVAKKYFADKTAASL